MKKIIKFLPAMAILLASGLAVATTSKVNTPNVKWIDSDWAPLEESYVCGDGHQPCVGYRASPVAPVTDITYGQFIPQ